VNELETVAPDQIGIPKGNGRE